MYRSGRHKSSRDIDTGIPAPVHIAFGVRSTPCTPHQNSVAKHVGQESGWVAGSQRNRIRQGRDVSRHL